MARVPVRDDLRALEGYHSPQVKVRVRLNTNEAPEAPPAAWREAYAAEVARIEWHRYPDRSATELRRAIASLHDVSAANVFAANGSNEVLQTLLLAYAGAGRTVATFEPTYQLHGHIARLSGARVVEGDRREDFTIDPAEVRRMMTTYAPEVTMVCSPNNPTGVVEAESTVRDIVASAPGLVIVDEAYAQFAEWSALSLLDEERPLVVVRTFSKTWSMAAARLGYVVAPTWVVEELDKVVLPYHLDTAKQIAGRLAVAYRRDMDDRVARITAERERITAALGRLAVQVWPSGANFVLFRPLAADAAGVWAALVERSILIRDCSSWPRLQGCLRVTVGTPEENEAFVTALTEVLGS
jgi:histidinol-phosphate aminotransferase